MRRLPKEEITTDVLVIGGGAAGLMAALEAKQKGLDVTVVSKSKIGGSGNTIISGTNMAILAPGPGTEDSHEIFVRDTLRAGKEVNDRIMMDLYLKGSSEIIDKLTECGVAFRKLDNQLMKKKAPGHSVPRSFTTDFSTYPYLTRGLSLTLPLLKTVQQIGIKTIDFAPVIKLLCVDGRVCGAIAICKKPETVLIFRTGVVILAAGGGGMLFARSNNTGDITGDSYGLAYETGALLRDMEFVQYYPTMMFSPIKVTISSPLFGEGAFLRNTHGERFMERYDTAGDMATRDIMTRAVFNEVMEGRGDKGNIYMDCRHLDEAMLCTKFAELLRLLKKVNINPLKDLIPISPATHFFMGGVSIDKKCETTVPGLLSCGESVGGLHGANRLGGNALSETFVFGMIAGRQAANKYNTHLKPDLPAFDIVPFQEGSISISELKQNLMKISWKYLSIVRNSQFCKVAKNEIKRISDALDIIRIQSTNDLVRYYELKNMITTVKLIIEGALARKESRGAHYRSDYPDTDNSKFRGNFFYQNQNGEIKLDYHPVSD